MTNRKLTRLSEAAMGEALSRTPIDQFVIWDGAPFSGRANSQRSRVFCVVTEVWTPISVRTIVQRCAESADGLHPDIVRSALRAHQAAQPATHLLARRDAGGSYVAVTDVPWPSAFDASLRAGDVILDRRGQRVDPQSFDIDDLAPRKTASGRV